MAKYQHAYLIDDQGSMKGGVIYDKFSNLSYFADVAGLSDLARTAADKQVAVKAHTASRFMGSNGTISRQSTTRNLSVGLRQSKGALPGYTVTFQSDEGTADEETRQFQWTGTMSALVAWLKTSAKVSIRLYGPTGTPYDPIPAVPAG